MEFVKQSWKAILAFVAVFVGQLAENLVSSNGAAVLPQTTAQWITLFSTSFGGAVVVYIARNKRSGGQIAADVAKLPADIAIGAADKVVGAVLDRVPVIGPQIGGIAQTVLDRLPKEVRTNILAKYLRLPE